jgi:hypothetical protein
MTYNAIFNEIFGQPEPDRSPIPPIPIVDDPPGWERYTPRSNPQFERDRLTCAVEAIYGYDLRKEAEADELSFNTQPPGPFELPPAMFDPRKPRCTCTCQMCAAQDHINCLDGGCSQSEGLPIPPAILDIAAEVREEFKDAVRSEMHKHFARTKRSREAEFMEKHYGYHALVGQFQR